MKENFQNDAPGCIYLSGDNGTNNWNDYTTYKDHQHNYDINYISLNFKIYRIASYTDDKLTM
jgi:hypothetical protein